MTVFEASVPRRKRTALVAPPGGREEERPATKNGDGSSGSDGSVVSTPSSSVTAVDGSEAVDVAAAELKSAEERERKGKMLAADESLPIQKNLPPPQPPVPKLMGDAIRAQCPVDTRAPEAFLAKANKKRKRPGHAFWAGTGREGQSTSSAGSSNVSLSEIDVVDDSLRHALRDLGASPVRIYGKRLSKSDRVMNQHRLLMSCKSWEAKHGTPFPLDQILTAEEKPLVHVQAYDRRGKSFVLECKKLTCNNAYRLIDGWGKFLTNNGLVVKQDAKPEKVELGMVELWAFRSPKLKVGVADQPHGPLGLVIVHYLQGESPHGDAAIAEMLAAGMSRVPMPRRRVHHVPRRVHHVQATHVHDHAVPVLEDAVQVQHHAVPVLEDAVQVHDHAVPILEDAVHAYEDAMPVLEEAMPDVEVDEEMVGMLEAAKAMIMLRYSFPNKKKRRTVRR